MSNLGDSAISLETKKQPSGCRDPLFAAVFYANLIIIAILCIKFGPDAYSSDAAAGSEPSPDLTGFLYAALSGSGISIVLSGLMILLMLMIASFLIKLALLFNVVMSGLLAVAAIATGAWVPGIIAVIFFLIFCCYAKAVWSRIPFATANLVTATKAIKANFGVTLIGYVMIVLALGWTVLWVTAALGVQDSIISCTTTQDANGNDLKVCENPNYGILFLFLVSYYFVHQVLKNVVHVTVAGVVGTWWFAPDEKGCCGKSIFGSLCRALTTSFGSICFGSLIVAAIQAVRTLVDVAKANDDIGSTLACCIDCILGCIESIVEYFNKWAFIYVGLYGYGYCEAGKSVMTLFRDRGWDAIIADDLIGMVLGMLSLVVGLITGGFTLIFVDQTSWFDEFIADNSKGNAQILAFIILLSSIDSGVLAVIVLFAEAPAEFESNYPELSKDMREAYGKAHPGYE